MRWGHPDVEERGDQESFAEVCHILRSVSSSLKQLKMPGSSFPRCSGVCTPCQTWASPEQSPAGFEPTLGHPRVPALSAQRANWWVELGNTSAFPFPVVIGGFWPTSAPLALGRLGGLMGLGGPWCLLSWGVMDRRGPLEQSLEPAWVLPAARCMGGVGWGAEPGWGDL